jgi:transcriptional repressor NrdR
MLCPICRASTKVLDSRDGRDESVRRRRQCLSCAHRFTTWERVEELLPSVVKRDGRRQPFDRAKILRGLELACRKRGVEHAVLEQVVEEVGHWASTRNEREVESGELGQQIMHRLYRIDPVAYVRFVSVYRSFESIAEFGHLLERMEKAEDVDPAGQRRLFGAPESDEPVALIPQSASSEE